LPVIRAEGLVPSALLCEKKFLEAISVECARAAALRMLDPEPAITKGCLLGLTAPDRQEA
jgi:hypothetical protein